MVGQLGGEFVRSLGTHDPVLARRMAPLVTSWFRQTVDEFRAMDGVSRQKLNEAADTFLATLRAEIQQPREFDPVHPHREIAINIELTRERAQALRDQLINGQYEPYVRVAATKMMTEAGLSLPDLDGELQLYAQRLAAKALLQQMRALDLSLSAPEENFVPTPLYEPGLVTNIPVGSDRPTEPSPSLQTSRSLADLVAAYIEARRVEDVSPSTIEETRRALAWMQEALDGRRPASEVTSGNLRDVRDGFQKMDVRKRGAKGPFTQRQTDNRDFWIAPQTSGKYWRSVQGFFRWLADERHIRSDPSAGIRPPRRANVEIGTPEAFSDEEVRRLLRTPLFAGRLHKNAYKSGEYVEQCSYWWAIMLALHTGMRAGEISQLETSDIDLAGSPPVIHVRRENAEGKVTKRTKNRSSIRDIPISTVLVRLGLEGFVEARMKAAGTHRLFPDLPLGTAGKTSSGLSHFLSRYLRQNGLWKHGRASHVFRHTVVAKMRAEGVAEEVMSATVGHTPQSQTGRYGKNSRPLSELAAAIERVQYGVDIPTLIADLEQAAHSRRREQ